MGTPGTDSSSWAGWAISSFTNKLAAADGVLEKATTHSNGVGTSPTTGPGTPGSPPTAPMPHHTSLRAAPPFSRSATETTKLAQSFSAPEAAEEAGFWDDEVDDAAADEVNDDADDGWAAMNHDVDEDAGPSAKPAAVVSKSVSRPPVTKQAAAPLDADGEPDFAGWLKAQQSASKVQTKALPKGLGTTKTTSTTSAAGVGSSSAARKPAVVAVKAAAHTGGASRAAVISSVVKKKAVVAEKPVVEKKADEDDEWGAWD